MLGHHLRRWHSIIPTLGWSLLIPGCPRPVPPVAAHTKRWPNTGTTLTQQTRDVETVLVYCWISVCDAGPTSNQHWFNVPSCARPPYGLIRTPRDRARAATFPIISLEDSLVFTADWTPGHFRARAGATTHPPFRDSVPPSVLCFEILLLGHTGYFCIYRTECCSLFMLFKADSACSKCIYGWFPKIHVLLQWCWAVWASIRNNIIGILIFLAYQITRLGI